MSAATPVLVGFIIGLVARFGVRAIIRNPFVLIMLGLAATATLCTLIGR